MNPLTHLSRLLLLPALLALAGCTGLDVLEPSTDNTKYHVLAAPSLENEIADPGPEAPLLVVGPVTVAPVLETRRLVIHEPGTSRVSFPEGHRWAEPMEAMVERVLVRSLRQHFPGYRVSTLRLASGMEAQTALSVHLDELSGEPGGALALQASWRVTPSGTEGTRLHETRLSARIESGGMDAYVEELAGLLEELAGEMAQSL